MSLSIAVNGPCVENAGIGFYTKVLSDDLILGDEIIIFDTVYINAGSGYDPESGMFTCPVTGNYFFYLVPVFAEVGSVSTMKMGIVDDSYPSGLDEKLSLSSYTYASTEFECLQGQQVRVQSANVDIPDVVTGSVFKGYLLKDINSV